MPASTLNYENPQERKAALKAVLFVQNTMVDGVEGFSENSVMITSEDKRAAVTKLIQGCPEGNRLLEYIQIEASGVFEAQ